MNDVEIWFLYPKRLRAAWGERGLTANTRGKTTKAAHRRKLLKVIDSGFQTPLPADMYGIITDRIRERGRALELALS